MKINGFFNKCGHYFVPALATFFIMMVAFLIKGVFPFGNGYVGIIDYVSGLVPSYTHLWDFMHGNNNFLFEENLGMGSNIYASSVLNTFLSPTSYLIGLFSRENVQYGIGFVVVLKMMLMATTFYIVTKKWFKQTDKKTLLIFSLLWSFSGWLFVHISNIGWLDVMIIFPLLIESLKVLVEKGKLSYFVGILTLSLIFSYYMSYMILIMMIIGIICVNKVLIDNKDDKRRIIGQVFIGTLFSLMLSMVAFLPSFIQTQASYRFSNTFEFNANYSYSKISILLFYGIIIYLPFILFKKHKDDKYVKFFGLFTAFTLLPVLVEPINKMWHTGSYFSYPFRFAYIPIFCLLITSLYYLEKYFDADQKEEKHIPNKWTWIIMLSIFILFSYFIALLVNIYMEAHLAFPMNLIIFLMYALLFVFVIMLMILCMKVLKKKYRKNALLIISVVQIFVYSVGYMGYVSNDKIDRIYDYKKNLKIDELDKNFAIKDETRSMINNFPLIIEHKSISTWLHINGYYANINAQSLGYGTESTQITSYGGTVFSDLLANTKYVISYEVMDESLYTLLAETKQMIDDKEVKVYLYEYKYSLPLGMIVDKELIFEDFDVTNNPFDTQNMIYHELFSQEDLINVNEYRKVKEKEIVYSVDEAQSVYLYIEGIDYGDIKIYVNDIEKEYISGTGIVNLGVYREDVNIKISSEDIMDTVYVADIDVEDIKNLTKVYTNNVEIINTDNKINIKVNSDKEGKIYVPINYENNSWSAINNNKNVNVERFLQTYIAIDVAEGENNIVLTFVPQQTSLGLKITLITIALVAILFVINIKYKFFEKKGLRNVCYYSGLVIGLAVFAYVYILPLTK